MRIRFLFAVTALASVASVQAAPNLVTNGSFEIGTDPGGFTTLNSGDNTSIVGWTVGGHSVDYIGTYWNASDGKRSVDLAGNNAGSVGQTVTGLTIGGVYHLTFDLAGNPDGAPQTKVTVVGADTTTTTFNVLNTGSLSNMSWANYGVYFTATSTSAFISFASGTPNSPYGPALDNVSLTAAPAPAAIVPMALGVAVGYRRRRSKT